MISLKLFLVFILGSIIGLITFFESPALSVSLLHRVRTPVPKIESATLHLSDRLGAANMLDKLIVPKTSETVTTQIQDWKNLIATRSSLTKIEWEKAREALMDRIKPYRTSDYYATLARWEDPEGHTRLKMMELWSVDSSGQSVTKFFESVSDRNAALELMATSDFSNDWVNSADYFAKNKDIEGQERAKLQDMLIATWSKEEGVAVPLFWLSEHAQDSQYDAARLTLCSKLTTPNNSLISAMSNESYKELSSYIAQAYQQSN